MEQEKILVVLPVREEQKDRIRNTAPDAKVIYCLEAEVTKEQVQDANIIIGNVKPEFLKDSPNLRWIQLNNAGTEGFCEPGVLPKQAQLTNATGAYGMAISEHLIAMLFALQKRLDIYHDQQTDHRWEKQTHMMVTEGSHVLVIGLGDIGTTFARKMKVLGAHVTGIRRSQKPKPEYVDAQYTMEALPELLPQADIVAMSLPGYSDTKGVIGEKELQLMKSNAILLNVGRGPLSTVWHLRKHCRGEAFTAQVWTSPIRNHFRKITRCGMLRTVSLPHMCPVDMHCRRHSRRF